METVPYVHEAVVHNTTSPERIVPVVMQLLAPKSVIDVGCGIGTFLYCFKEAGVTDVLGVDGPWVDREQLHAYIRPEEFIERSLDGPLRLDRTFDLVLCLEVAEHLPASAADTFVSSLVAAGRTILFSAAIPFQGGQNHVNEQWPVYWEEKFAKHGYVRHDIIRPLVWDDPGIFWWYKQNMVVYAHRDIRFPATVKYGQLGNVIHPELFVRVASIPPLTLARHIKNRIRSLLFLKK